MSTSHDAISIGRFLHAMLRDVISVLRHPAPVLQGLLMTLRLKLSKKMSIGKLLEEQAARIPDRPAIRYRDSTWSYAALNARANQVAALLQKEGIQSGDTVAIMMETDPELLACIAGVVKIGAIAGILNHHQRDTVLTHSISLIKPRLIIAASDCVQALATTDYAPANTQAVIHYCLTVGDNVLPEGYRDWRKALALMPDANPPTTSAVTLDQTCFYVFTSGTTGLPKASKMSHYRWLMGMCGVGLLATRLRADDVLYVTLPFYHNNALTVSWGAAMGAGACMALSRKFSASRFWEDIRQYEATAFCYIGELCTYLLNQPVSVLDDQHKVRVMAGNGMRPEHWDAFRQRFGIERVAEFYGASECNLAFINYLNIERTVGMCPLPYAVIAYDADTELPLKTAGGRYARVKKGEAGLLITKVHALAPYEGYTEQAASEKKLLRNVFKDGDCWFNTGDLVRDQGCFHIQFVDRLGDTFRWKGENVATTEVEVVLNRDKQIEQAVVYGVQVPHASGRAGMAAVTLTVPVEEFDTAALASTLRQQLPSYAMPLFLRVRAAHEVTGTFKNRKVELKREGFDINAVSDPLFWYVSQQGRYERLDAPAMQAICSGQQRL